MILSISGTSLVLAARVVYSGEAEGGNLATVESRFRLGIVQVVSLRSS